MISHSYQLHTGMRCVKNMLFVINFMFMLTGILLILVGTTIQAVFIDFKQFIDDDFLSPPTLLVAIGFIMLIVSSFGCYGAIKESTMLINLYGVFLLLIFILEVSASITAFVYQGQIKNMLNRTMINSFNEYESNLYINKSINFLQSGLECCGVNEPSDWETILHVNQNTSDPLRYIPLSCCYRLGEHIEGKALECFEYFETGCLPKLAIVISSSAMLIATGATAVAFVQLLGAFCAFMLAKTVRRNKSIREARRWQLQQGLGILTTSDKNEISGYTQLSKEETKKCEPEPVIYTATSPSVH